MPDTPSDHAPAVFASAVDVTGGPGMLKLIFWDHGAEGLVAVAAVVVPLEIARGLSGLIETGVALIERHQGAVQ